MKKFALLAVTLLLAVAGFAEEVKTVLIDVRTPKEYASGHLEGAISMPSDKIVKEIVKKYPDRTTKIQLYCQRGVRAELARKSLVLLGYKNVSSLGGFLNAANKSGKKVVK